MVGSSDVATVGDPPVVGAPVNSPPSPDGDVVTAVEGSTDGADGDSTVGAVLDVGGMIDGVEGDRVGGVVSVIVGATDGIDERCVDVLVGILEDALL